MAHYNCMLIDLDNTLLDFDAAEDAALRQTLRYFELPEDAATIEKYKEINRALWKELEQGTLKKGEAAGHCASPNCWAWLKRSLSAGKINENLHEHPVFSGADVAGSD